MTQSPSRVPNPNSASGSISAYTPYQDYSSGPRTHSHSGAARSRASGVRDPACGRRRMAEAAAMERNELLGATERALGAAEAVLRQARARVARAGRARRRHRCAR